MSLKFVSLLFVIVLSGCATWDDPDFSKTLIPFPERQAEKHKEEKAWVEAKTSRAWVNAHVDENSDLVEGHYKHIVIEAGHWAVKPDGK
ncbi:MAG: hypothetical protein Q7K71_01385 [Candidatus Omnitrophota bacterium]|nr:hypothetical protein [Candidatus Omnitrophota bacterium]